MVLFLFAYTSVCSVTCFLLKMIFYQVIVLTLHSPPVWHWSICLLSPLEIVIQFMLPIICEASIFFFFFCSGLLLFFFQEICRFFPFAFLLNSNRKSVLRALIHHLRTKIQYWFGLHNSQVICFLSYDIHATERRPDFPKRTSHTIFMLKSTRSIHQMTSTSTEIVPQMSCSSGRWWHIC